MSQHSRRLGRRSGSGHPSRPRRRIAVGLCAALALIWALAWAPALAGQVSAAPAQPASSGAQQAVQLDSPAVVRIVSVINATLTCKGCASDGSDIHSPSGSAPFTYYSSGSGAFISPDGAILTADHVVDHSMSNSEDVAFVEQQAAQDIATQYTVTSDQALTYLQNHPTRVTIDFQVAFQKAFLSTSYTGNLPDTRHIYAFTIASIVASSPVDKQDTAIVRIDTRGISPAPDFPYLHLSLGQVNPLDNVTAIAFPADADLALNTADFTALADVSSSDVNTINSLLSPSVNTGTITKTNEIRPDGTPVYEASSIASNGSSGGPVINDQGQVIGFVDAGTATDRLTFIIPSAVAQKYATQAGVANPPAGRFMSLWSQAFGEYTSTAACHWTTAANELTTLKRQYPTFGGVAPYLAQAKQNAATEACANATPAGGASTTTVAGDVAAGFWLIGGCVVATLALMLGVIFLAVALTRRRSRRKPAPVASTPAAPYPPQGQAPYAPTPYTPGAYPPAPTPYTPAARVCQNGHVVIEADAAFCPVCGAPLRSGPSQ